VQVGNAYVNRHITGAIVQRQPFGGWKQSSVGGGPKAGGPHTVAAFVRTRPTVIDVDAASASYREAWSTRFSTEHDPSGLRSERNVLRYRPLGHVLLLDGDDTPTGAIEAARAAAAICGVGATVSHVDDPDARGAACLSSPRPDRVRLLTAVGDELLRACHRDGITVDRTPVSADGALELIHWVREQAISETRHRYGRIRPDLAQG
jgi:RHH-type proline utilization regulon transcriptional repressor/proline dehydrogenase/delta 1-pyrroline-5-carboxylate dehydrogenase